MKSRRNPVTSCFDCAMSFESNDSCQWHLSSCNHIQQVLGIRNKSLMNCMTAHAELGDRQEIETASDSQDAGSTSELEDDF